MTPTDRRRRRLGCLVTLVTLAIGLVGLEVGFRVYLLNFAPRERAKKWLRPADMPKTTLRYAPHPYTVYGLNPDFRSDDGLDRHFPPGFRGDAVDAEPKPGVVRIACLGGSSTYDTEIASFQDAYPAVLERALRDEHGRETEVINAGVPGYTSFESLVHLEMRVLPFRPDVVIVYHAVNDVHARLVPPEDYRRDNTGYRHEWREVRRWWDRSMLLHAFGVQARFSQRNNLRAWTMTLDDRPPESVRDEWLDENPPAFFRRNLEAMVALVRTTGARPVLMTWAHSPHMDDYASTAAYRRGFAEHNDVIREVAASTGAELLDFAPAMPQDPEYWHDGRHSNERGARFKAEWVARELVERGLL